MCDIYTKFGMYSVEIIDINKAIEFKEQFSGKVLYEEKADIYGVCIKLLTDLEWVDEVWRRNFYAMSSNIRSHGRLYVFSDSSLPKNKVYYDPFSRTAFLFNFDYYGWIKSLALSLAGDILEDEHNIYSIHGACLDVDGKGIALIGGSGAGKTTHTYGLMRFPMVRVIADDWFFVRAEETLLAFSSERNFYIRADLASLWPEYSKLIENAEFDNKGRAIVDLRWVVGKARILPLTTLKVVIILKRDYRDPVLVRRLDSNSAIEHLLDIDFGNPHFLVKDERKIKLRLKFFRKLLSNTEVHMINTRERPEKVQELLLKILNLNLKKL